MTGTTRLGRVAATLACAAIVTSTARADRIVLNGGTVLRGVILPETDPAEPEIVRIQTETGREPLTFRKGQIARVEREPSILDEYLTRRKDAPAAAQGQYDLGLWCETHKLRWLAEHHYAKAIEQDKTFEPAHRKLGHVKQGDRWMTVDESREAQGLVLHKGQWITPEQKQKLDEQAAETAEQGSWTRRLRPIRHALLEGDADRRAEAERQLMAIRDPLAIAPLTRTFVGDAEPVRVLLTQTLAMIPGTRATEALVKRLLADPSLEVRQATLDQLAPRSVDDPGVVRQLTQALASTNLAVSGRAAWALAGLKATSAVPKMIQALVRIETRLIWLPDPADEALDGPVGLPLSGPFLAPGTPIPSQGPVGRALSGVPGVAASPAPGSVGATNFNTVTSGYMLQGPVVAPGVVAFGAGSTPFINGQVLPRARRGPQPNLARFEHTNSDVLDALKQLTDQDFGYNQAAWRRWLASSFQAEPVPARRVPQP